MRLTVRLQSLLTGALAVASHVMLPKIDGFTVCRRIREFSKVPIIMVTAKDDPTDPVMGLNLGADDYLVKPFVVEELLARVKAVIRRACDTDEAKAPSHLNLGSLSIHFAEHKVYRGGNEVNLSPTEYRLLATLAGNRNRIMTHDDLLTRVWGPEYRGALEYTRWDPTTPSARPVRPWRRKAGRCGRTRPGAAGAGWCLRLPRSP